MKTLGFRVVFLIIAIGIYIYDASYLNFTLFPQGIISRIFLLTFWIMLFVGMIFRIFPNKRISAGAGRHFVAVDSSVDKVPHELVGPFNKKTRAVAVVWVVFNGILFMGLRFFNLMTPAVALLISLFYTLCDVLFIVIWCPFQKFFMQNRCCTECRIYNWDYLMMVTPLIFFPSVFSLILVAFALIVFIRWELAAARNPYVFLPKAGNCAACGDRLCFIKKRLGRAVSSKSNKGVI